MTRSDVHEACAGRIFDEVVAGIEVCRALNERWLDLDLAELSPVQSADDLVPTPSALLRDGGEEHGGEDVRLVAHTDHRVSKGRIVGNGQVGRQSPRRSRPDQDE